MRPLGVWLPLLDAERTGAAMRKFLVVPVMTTVSWVFGRVIEMT